MASRFSLEAVHFCLDLHPSPARTEPSRNLIKCGHTDGSPYQPGIALPEATRPQCNFFGCLAY